MPTRTPAPAKWTPPDPNGFGTRCAWALLGTLLGGLGTLVLVPFWQDWSWWLLTPLIVGTLAGFFGGARGLKVVVRALELGP